MDCCICIQNISYRVPCIIIISITANACIIPVIRHCFGKSWIVLSHFGSEAFIVLTIRIFGVWIEHGERAHACVYIGCWETVIYGDGVVSCLLMNWFLLWFIQWRIWKFDPHQSLGSSLICSVWPKRLIDFHRTQLKENKNQHLIKLGTHTYVKNLCIRLINQATLYIKLFIK